MARTRISRDLGPLPRRSALAAARDRADGLRQILRSLALKNQHEQPRVFYSLREVATQFRVPVSTVSKIYHDLEQEGFLSRVRSSKTILNGLRHNRKLSIRGFVGLPALVANFVTIQDYRTLLNCIRRELWLRGFAATTVFFEPFELANGMLADQFKSHEVDTVIWLYPGRTAMETLLRLSDIGIRVIAVSQVGTPGVPSRYFVWKDLAIEKLFRDWRDRDSLHNITLVDSREYRSPVTEELVRLVLQNFGIEPVARTFQGGDSSAFLLDLCRTKTSGIVIPSVGLASMFAFRNPDQLADLLSAQHVAFVDGPIDMPFAKIRDVSVDLVAFDWRGVAESIVNDLITRAAFDHNRYTTFNAEAHFNVSLSSFAHEMRPIRGIWAPE